MGDASASRSIGHFLTTARGEPVTRGMYFDELKLGDSFQTATATMTPEDIVRFGHEWDPQPFHVDADAAKSSMFGGLIASGLHTVVTTYRLFDDLALLRGTALAGVGYRDIRFRRPVYPGDVLQARATIAALAASRRPEAGVATFCIRTVNQDEVEVLSMSLLILVGSRHPISP